MNARSNSSRSGRDTGKQAPGPSADQPGRSALPLAERRKRHVGTRRAIIAVKAAHAADRTKIEVAADYLTRVASSAPFLIVHVVWFGVWIAWNTRLLGLAPFDPYPFGLLTMIVSLEAIFLSIFVLMSQSREATIAELREEVTLAVNLRMEQEVTKTLQLVVGLYARLGHQLGDDPELDEMLRPLDADRMERDLLAQIEAASAGPGREKKNGAASGQR